MIHTVELGGRQTTSAHSNYCTLCIHKHLLQLFLRIYSPIWHLRSWVELQIHVQLPRSGSKVVLFLLGALLLAGLPELRHASDVPRPYYCHHIALLQLI